MKSERTKAVLFMLLTFIVGIVIGAFIPGLIMRARFSDMNSRPDMRNVPPSPDRFERMLYRVVNPDSLQVEQIKPLARQASALIDTIQSNANKEIREVIDSLKTKLHPILTPDQQKRLDNFGDRSKSFDRGGPQGRPDAPGRIGPGGDRPRDDNERRGGDRPVGSAM